MTQKFPSEKNNYKRSQWVLLYCLSYSLTLSWSKKINAWFLKCKKLKIALPNLSVLNAGDKNELGFEILKTEEKISQKITT